MRHSGFVRVVKAKVFFTKEEVKGLMWLSAHHYDIHCRQVGKAGGFLYAIDNFLPEPDDEQYDDDIHYVLDFRQVDTLAKITEPVFNHPRNMIEVHRALKKVLADLNEEYRRLSSITKEDEDDV